MQKVVKEIEVVEEPVLVEDVDEEEDSDGEPISLRAERLKRLAKSFGQETTSAPIKSVSDSEIAPLESEEEEEGKLGDPSSVRDEPREIISNILQDWAEKDAESQPEAGLETAQEETAQEKEIATEEIARDAKTEHEVSLTSRSILKPILRRRLKKPLMRKPLQVTRGEAVVDEEADDSMEDGNGENEEIFGLPDKGGAVLSNEQIPDREDFLHDLESFDILSAFKGDVKAEAIDMDVRIALEDITSYFEKVNLSDEARVHGTDFLKGVPGHRHSWARGATEGGVKGTNELQRQWFS